MRTLPTEYAIPLYILQIRIERTVKAWTSRGGGVLIDPMRGGTMIGSSRHSAMAAMDVASRGLVVVRIQLRSDAPHDQTLCSILAVNMADKQQARQRQPAYWKESIGASCIDSGARQPVHRDCPISARDR